MNRHIPDMNSLITTKEQTQNSLINTVKEKQKILNEFHKDIAKVKEKLSQIQSVNELKNTEELFPILLIAAGVSEKSIPQLSPESKEGIINSFIKTINDENFREKIFYNFILMKGDALGGSIRNQIGTTGEEKFVSTLIRELRNEDIDFFCIEKTNKKWQKNSYKNIVDIQGLYWKIGEKERLLFLRKKLPLISKNVDICLCNSNMTEYRQKDILRNIHKVIMVGEIKSGADPAGADEHWKTANTALKRVREGYSDNTHRVLTSIIANAITQHMAKEIYEQLHSCVLDGVANLNNESQVTEYCKWIISL